VQYLNWSDHLPDCKQEIKIVTIDPNFQNRSASPWAENQVLQDGKTLDVYGALDKFQEWLKEKYATLPKFDHAMAFTGFVYKDI